MSLHVLIALVLLVVVLCGLFAGRFRPDYVVVGSIVGALCAVLLFLMAIGALGV